MAKKKTSPSDTPPGTTKSPAPRRRTSPPRAAAADRPVSSGVPDQATTQDPTYDQIAEAAYQRYLSRGGSHGRDFDDWLEAERELRSRR